MKNLTYWTKVAVICLLCAATAIGLPAQTFKVLINFYAPGTGSNPWGSLIQGTDGNLYGTTRDGGAYGDGVVFNTIPTAQNFTVLTSFIGYPTNGNNPEAALVGGTNGNYYGTTFSGGTEAICSGGCGTVFKITSTGRLTTLHSFDYDDGQNPSAGLVQATNGSFYGTTYGGGAPNYDGTVFKITPSGTLTTLHSFAGGSDGESPWGSLVQVTNGNLYGTTIYGGGGGCPGGYGCGTVFKITPAGKLTILHSFGGSDGEAPIGALLQATNGKLYGTTSGGGANSDGTIFKITLAGTLTPLHTFSYWIDGSQPYGGLIQATDGNLYGTTLYGGPYGSGTIFKITPGGMLTTLHSFNGTDGAAPNALLQGTDGNFYGTTMQGGSNGDGTFFSLSVGLGPFVKTLPTSGKVGSVVKILGTNLTGASSISFNGTAAAFTVVSASLITTTVPSGATTGTVQVVTPSGTLSSNVPFRVP